MQPDRVSTGFSSAAQRWYALCRATFFTRAIAEFTFKSTATNLDLSVAFLRYKVVRETLLGLRPSSIEVPADDTAAEEWVMTFSHFLARSHLHSRLTCADLL